MKTFRVIGKILAESGLGTDQYVSIAGRKIPRSLIRFCIFTFLFVGTILEVVICVHRSADGYATILYPVSVVLTFLSGALIYASLLLKPTQIVELFNYLENVVNSRSKISTELLTIYQTRIASTNKLLLMLSSLGCQAAALAHLIPILYPILYVTTGRPSPDTWFTASGINELSAFFGKNSLGFGIIVFVSCLIAAGYMLAIIAFTTIYVGISTNIEAFVDDISINIVHLNTDIGNKMLVKTELHQFISLHLHCFKLMEMLEDIIRAPIFYQIAVFAFQFSMMLYEIERNVTKYSLEATAPALALSLFTTLNYFLCYFITALMINVMTIGDHIYELHWYQLSRNEQFVVQMIIERSQKPFELKGLGVFECSLETFLKLTRTALSYYMVFRQLSDGI